VRTTVGQLLINEILPEDMQDFRRTIDKKSIRTLMRELADKHPEEYREVSRDLMTLGAEVATTFGGEASISLDSLKIGKKASELRSALKNKVKRILASGADDETKNNAIIRAIGSKSTELRDVNFKEQLALRNAMAVQVASGARGNPAQFSSANVGDLLVQDHRDNIIPIPLLNSYAEGLDPVEYWAGSYGARKGMVDLKFATPKGGFLGKQLALAAHRLRVTEDDCGTTNGIPMESGDPDNEGAVLARDAGGLEPGTILNPRNIKAIKRQDNIIVRSPLTCQAKGGICALCAGVRERGKLPEIGDNVGIAAAQAVAEPVAQSAMSSKHTGGIAGIGPSAGGFDAINQLTQVPKTFKGGASVARNDGVVDSIEDAPQGGKFITVGAERHFVSPEFGLKVNKGDKVEAGDVLSDGLPNPGEIVKHKGIGAGRWHFVKHFQDTLRASKISAHRRNVELLARGLINHARIIDADGSGDTLPNDIVEFDTITRGYKPREGFKVQPPKRSVGRYLEQPMLQYSIGTRITPRIAAELHKYGVGEVQSHENKPAFAPEMVRAMETLGHNDDWMVRLGGFHLKKNLLESVHRGRGAREHGESFIPALAKGTEFGKSPTEY